MRKKVLRDERQRIIHLVGTGAPTEVPPFELTRGRRRSEQLYQTVRGTTRQAHTRVYVGNGLSLAEHGPAHHHVKLPIRLWGDGERRNWTGSV